MNRSRKNLIEELMRVGNLIDPISNARTEEGEQDKTSLNTSPHESLMQRSHSAPEDIPVVDDVVEEPYATRDMFEVPEQWLQMSEPEDLDGLVGHKSRNLKDIESDINEHSTAVNSRQHLEPPPGDTDFPIDDLAYQLVMLIEKQVSKRSGEELDDVFREELTKAVTAELHSWLDAD